MGIKNKQGFTIIELLIVIVVIAVLASISVVAFNGIRARAIDSQKATMANNVQKAVENFYTINGRYPATNEVQTADLAQLGLTSKDVEPTGYQYPGYGIEGGWTDSTTTGLRYIAHPNPDSSGPTCNKPTICRHYTLGYWSNTENKAIVVSRGQ